MELRRVLFRYGTPETRAAIVEKLVQTGFAERNGKQILPKKNGTLLISVLPDNLISADMTSEWENALTLISKGQENPKEFIQGIKNMITELVERYRAFDKSKENPFADKSIERYSDDLDDINMTRYDEIKIRNTATITN